MTLQNPLPLGDIDVSATLNTFAVQLEDMGFATKDTSHRGRRSTEIAVNEFLHVYFMVGENIHNL